jgi:hypothetical protein
MGHKTKTTKNISRMVSEINITNNINARIGELNNPQYNFYGVYEQQFDRNIIPFFISYQIPKELVGMQLTWQGDILWPNINNDYQVISHQNFAAKTITSDDIGKQIYLSGINGTKQPIKVYLQQPIFYQLSGLLSNILMLAGIAIILSIFTYQNYKNILIASSLIILQLLNVMVWGKDLLQGMPILDGGNDGLVFYGCARLMLQHLLQGNYLEVLRGMESSFYFMPGLRYVRLIELILFGDSCYGYLLFLLFIPIIILYFLRSIFPGKLSWILLGLFFVPWLKYFGFANVAYIKFALDGFSETLSYGLFILSLGIIINLLKSNHNLIRNFIAANFLLAIAVFARPNLILASTLLIWFGIFKLFNKLSVWQIIVILSGFSPILFMPWHNWFFGQELAMFTGKKSFYINLITPPITYLNASLEIINGKIGTATQQIWNHILLWNPPKYIFRLPVFIAAIYCLINKQINSSIKLLASLGLIMQAQLLFFHPGIRYAGLAWCFCLLTFIYLSIELKNRYKNEPSIF